MAGYHNYSMSNNAVEAYSDGEKPLSKWTKTEILEVIEELNLDNFSMDNFKNLNLVTLKSYFLIKSSWHHTSKFYNETEFYEVDIDSLESLTDAKIFEFVEAQKKSKLTDEEKALKKVEMKRKVVIKAQKEKENIIKIERIRLFKYQSKYKTVNGFLKSNIDFESLSKIRLEKINKKREELRTQWERQFPSGCWQLTKIDDNNFVESYIKN